MPDLDFQYRYTYPEMGGLEGAFRSDKPFAEAREVLAVELKRHHSIENFKMRMSDEPYEDWRN